MRRSNGRTQCQSMEMVSPCGGSRLFGGRISGASSSSDSSSIVAAIRARRRAAASRRRARALAAQHKIVQQQQQLYLIVLHLEAMRCEEGKRLPMTSNTMLQGRRASAVGIRQTTAPYEQSLRTSWLSGSAIETPHTAHRQGSGGCPATGAAPAVVHSDAQ